VPEQQTEEGVRAAEVIGAACLATDLGMGFPFEHGLEATVVSARLARLLDVDIETESEVFYLTLLMYLGCNTDSEPNLRIFGGSGLENITPHQFGSNLEMLRGVIRNLPDPHASPLTRTYQTIARLPQARTFRDDHFESMCEVAAVLSDRLGAPGQVSRMFNVLTERWDGNGVLGRADREGLPIAMRIVHVARDGTFQSLLGGVDHAAAVVRERAGGAFDPEIARVFADNAGDLLTHNGATSLWETFLALEPKPHRMLDSAAFDRALAALGDFADMVSPRMSGHSPGVAELASTAAGVAGLDEEARRRLRHAGLVHDVGRAAIHPRVWQKPTELSADEWEKVRLHPYHTSRVLDPSESLRGLAELACCHHEKLDASGYHRGVPAAALDPAARILAAADAFHALGEPRHHREPMSADDAAAHLTSQAREGKLDRDAVEATLEAAGLDSPRVNDPADLTTREAEVIGLLARGLQTKQIASRLDISAKTADRHIQNSYRKIGVSTRAAATLYATEHGLVAWGEFPIK
jgi:HD-GYP domain-containing protein (c-di-GMP phosphodiesterase class II)/DNA-binding CsgD family transcriptional regulator